MNGSEQLFFISSFSFDLTAIHCGSHFTSSTSLEKEFFLRFSLRIKLVLDLISGLSPADLTSILTLTYDEDLEDVSDAASAVLAKGDPARKVTEEALGLHGRGQFMVELKVCKQSCHIWQNEEKSALYRG